MMWILSHIANALGDWSRSLGYCDRALRHGEAANDLRLKVVAWSRMAASQVQRGDGQAALASCAAAMKLGPTPFDAANLDAIRGYALVKIGDAPAGLRLLHDAVQWFAGTHLQYNRSTCSGWLAESLVRSGDREAGRAVAAAVLETSRSVGYRYVQGIAHRVLGESLMPDDVGGAAGHLQDARDIFEQIDARNDLAKTLVTQAAVHAARAESDQARAVLDRAARIFEALGTIDEPDRVRAALRALPGGANTSANAAAAGEND
jgi:tetratricopeptide (TPR) repeat protein